MAIYTFADARTQLKARVGHRTDVTDADVDKFLNQAQLVLATNVKGIDVFDAYALNILVPPNVSSFPIASYPALSGLWAIESMKNLTVDQAATRGTWAELLRLSQFSPGPLLRWVRRHGSVNFPTFEPTLTTEFIIYFRRLPQTGVLEVPDEWFEHLLNIASIYVYPTIGRNKDRDVLFQRLPQNLQLAVVNPMTPSMYESLWDEGVSFYTER